LAFIWDQGHRQIASYYSKNLLEKAVILRAFYHPAKEKYKKNSQS